MLERLRDMLPAGDTELPERQAPTLDLDALWAAATTYFTPHDTFHHGQGRDDVYCFDSRGPAPGHLLYHVHRPSFGAQYVPAEAEFDNDNIDSVDDLVYAEGRVTVGWDLRAYADTLRPVVDDVDDPLVAPDDEELKRGRLASIYLTPSTMTDIGTAHAQAAALIQDVHAAYRNAVLAQLDETDWYDGIASKDTVREDDDGTVVWQLDENDVQYRQAAAHYNDLLPHDIQTGVHDGFRLSAAIQDGRDALPAPDDRNHY